MEYRVDYELPTKEEIKQYSKDTLSLIFQNKWLGLKLMVGGIVGSSIIGMLILAPFVIGMLLTKQGYSPEFLMFFYNGTSDFLRLIFSSVPFWLILFYTGFRLMESRGFVIPAGMVVRKHAALLRHLWSPGILGVAFLVLLIFGGLFYSVPAENPDKIDEVNQNGFAEVSLMVVSSFLSRGIGLDLGFYWFNFIHIMIFSALLFGKDAVPNISYTLQNLFLPKVALNNRLRIMTAFIIIDLIEITVRALLYKLAAGPYGYGFSIAFSAAYYLFVAGVFYCYCVDKIEGRKLKKKVKEEKHSGIMAPMGA